MINALFTIAGTVLAGVLLYYLTKDKIELQYYLTEPIPLTITGGEVKESVQQLTVLNSGDVAIESIGIKIKGKIKEAKLVKNFVDDEVVQNVTETFLQAKYSKLLPSSKFSYTIKSNVGGISSAHIDISYPKGKAINALEPADNSSALTFIYIAIIISSAIYIIASSFKMQKVSKLNLSSYEKILTVLNESKPFYINQRDWDEVRKDYILSKRDIKHFYCSNLQEDESYKILNAIKPDKVSDFEWLLIKETMAAHFEDLFLYKVKCSNDTESLYKILTITKPANFLESKWNELIEIVYKELFAVNNLDKSLVLITPESVAKIIRKVPSVNVDSEVLEDYKTALKRKYFSYVLVALSEQYFYQSTKLDNFDLELLNDSEKKRIVDFDYKLKFMQFRNITSIHDAEHLFEKSETSDSIRAIRGVNYDFLSSEDRS